MLASVGLPVDALVFLDDVVDAAYRYARHAAGTDVVLTGTGKIPHLEANVASLLRPPLSDADLARLDELFGAIDTITGN